jgi:hypothetical protein
MADGVTITETKRVTTLTFDQPFYTKNGLFCDRNDSYFHQVEAEII